jgi:hypothetical protein
MATKSIFVFFLFLFLSGTYPAYFAQQMAVELKDLSKGAEVILTGKVTGQTSSWNEDNTRIYTEATIRVEEYLKGTNGGNSVVVRYLGGEVGNVGETYSHVPTFEDNEQVILFLKKNDNKTDYTVLYGEDGKINLTNDPRTGELVTSSNVPVSSLKAQIKNFVTE